MSLFSASDVAISAGGQRLVEGWSLALEAGELVALVGPSGSGKTTLLRCLAMLSDPDAGELRLRGKAPSDHGYPAWRRRVALVSQRPVLLEATVRENLARPFAYETGAAASFPEARARAWLEQVGVGPDRFDQIATTLSEGQQQRVALVRTLLLEPDVLLLDEPTSALDPDALASVESLVTDQVRAHDRAALIVTHDPPQTDRWCDRATQLRDGE
jgi:putative ABC transport system ATP-binding protein